MFQVFGRVIHVFDFFLNWDTFHPKITGGWEREAQNILKNPVSTKVAPVVNGTVKSQTCPSVCACKKKNYHYRHLYCGKLSSQASIFQSQNHLLELSTVSANTQCQHLMPTLNADTKRWHSVPTLNADAQRWCSMPTTLNADTLCRHSTLTLNADTQRYTIPSCLQWIPPWPGSWTSSGTLPSALWCWSRSLQSSCTCSATQHKFMYMFCNTGSAHGHVLKHSA